MGAQTMLWASDATWVAMLRGWRIPGPALDVGKGLASLVVPVDDRDDSKTMLWD